MRESKLVKLVASLPAWDLRHLRDFVHSPFFNKHERLTALLDIVVDAAPDFDAAVLERRAVWAQVFPGEAWEEQRFKDLLSMGVKLMRQFAGQMYLREHGFPLGLAALEGMRVRGWEGEYTKAREALAQGLASGGQKFQERYLHRLQVQENWISHISASGSRKLDDSLQVASDQLDAFYILSKLKYGVGMLNRQQVLAERFDFGLLPELLEALRARPALMEEHPAIQIYYLLYACQAHPEEDLHFEGLRAAMRRSIREFPRLEQREVYGFAFNHCIRRVNQGRRAFLDALLELYEEALGQGVLMVDGWLSQWDYKNIVSAGLKAGRFDWCASLIEGYRDKVEPDARENAYTYNLACLHFEQGDYRRALRLLQHVEFNDVFYHLGAKVMLLKSYYELNEHDALLNLCDAFKIYLKRSKTLSKAHQTLNHNLVLFTRKLSELRRKSELMAAGEFQRKLSELGTQIRENGSVAQLAWLLGKVEALREGGVP